MNEPYSIAASDEPYSDNCYLYFIEYFDNGIVMMPILMKRTWKEIDKYQSPWIGRDPNEGGLI
jgi:hypothetical protein